MSKLEFHLERLITWLRELSIPPPSWSRIAIVESDAIHREKITRILRAALSTPEDYAGVFDDYLGRGYHWINMNAFGIVEDVLLVVIELPPYTSPITGRSSVNLSGPAIINGTPQWDISRRVELIEN